MFIRIFSLLALLTLAGCASNPMTVSPQQTLQTPSQDSSQVVFMRSSFVGSAISASLYDVTDGDIKFIGVIVNGVKLAYSTTPGEHTFMVVSEAADFMEADLSSGKNYFSLVTPRMGAWKARFSLWPIKNDPTARYHTDMTEFDQWLTNTKLSTNSEKSQAWYQQNKNSVKAKYDKYWPAWQQKADSDIAKRTLVPTDGK